jgi:hypothetical protein
MSKRSLVSLLACLLVALNACAAELGDEPGDAPQDDSTGTAHLEQRKDPTPSGSCTLNKCSGIKDPFGTYECKDGKCSCRAGGSVGSCDANNQNCSEKCDTPPPTETPSRGFPKIEWPTEQMGFAR